MVRDIIISLLTIMQSFTLGTFCFGNERIAVIADFDLGDIPTDWEMIKEGGYDVELISHGNFRGYIENRYDPKVKKIILMNPYVALEQDLNCVPKETLVLFSWEPVGVNESFSNLVSAVYTYDNRLVDNKKYYKFFYPYLKEMITDIPSFKDKKPFTMVTRHWTTERCEVVEFFSDKERGLLEFYGSSPGSFGSSPMYKGAISGYHSGDQKINVLKQYRFCFCYENTHYIPGYVTEKIFACFAAGCVPIYYGAPDITEYIPKGCYIDYRDYQDLPAIYNFLMAMDENLYQSYIDNIQNYLNSQNSYVFSPKHFQETILQAIIKN